MNNIIRFLTFLISFLLCACFASPPQIAQVVYVTREIEVTQVISKTATPRVVVIANKPTPTLTLHIPTKKATLSHDWVDYGGICMRPDNLPDGVQINPDVKTVAEARGRLLEGLWRLIVESESASKLVPGFSSSSNLISASLKGVALRGPLIPVGKSPPRSDAWSFYLEDAGGLWKTILPGQKFKGVALDLICIEFFPPLEFEAQKRIDGQFSYFHLVGGVTHAKFGLEEIHGSPRITIKFYQNPYGGQRNYVGLSGFAPSNTAIQNAVAANEHFGALLVTFDYALWGNFDGDGVMEFGFGPKNSAPLPIETFQAVDLFVPVP